MSRARTLAGAIGSDGALNVADVAGLAAVASSGSASDLTTGTLPIARVADNSVTASKLASTAVTDKLGYTPIRKTGDTGLSGYFQKAVADVDAPMTGGTQAPGSVQRDVLGWKIFADLALSNQAGGTQYLDLKTNVISNSSMMYFKLEGYAYNYGNVHSYHGLYMYVGSQVLNRFTNNLAGQITFYDSYKASDGSLCLKINMGGVFYTSARARLYVQSHDDNFDSLQIVSMTRSNSTSAQY